MYIDPEIATWLTGLIPLDIADLPAARRASAFNQAGATCEGTHDGEMKIMGSGPRAIFNIHGGGFVLGSTTSDDPENALLIRELGVSVVSPEYELAPENPYPGPLTQCCKALQRVVRELDPHPIIMGHSAGGGLAAMVTQWALKNGIAPAAQVLIEPEIDPTLSTQSMKTYAAGPVWTAANGRLSWDYLLGGKELTIPARQAPQTYVVVNHSDPLRDEGVNYALALADAGTPVTLKMYPGTTHGSMSCLTAGVTTHAYDELIAYIRQVLKGK